MIKLYTAACILHLQDVLAALTDTAPAERLALRLGRAMRERPQHLQGLEDGLVLSSPPLAGPVLFWENGLRSEADPIRGQKMGFHLDQRENRARVELLASAKDVLNLSFLPPRAPSPSTPHLVEPRKVVGIDASAAASHETVVDDTFEALARMGRSGLASTW